MRITRDGFWIVLGFATCAFAACSKGSLTPDAGSGVGGGSGTTGVGGRGGGAGGVTGTGGLDSCAHAPEITGCTPPGVTPPSGPDDRSSCSAEGAVCNGTFCYDFHGEATFVSACCAGKWWPGWAGPCPAVLQPGDPFPCGNGPTCAAYQSYCSISNADRGPGHDLSCQPLCVAGDCSCFCDKPEGCDFDPPGSTCPADRCTCVINSAQPGIQMPGVIVVQCKYAIPGTAYCVQNPSLDSQCPAGNIGFICEASVADVGGCTRLPDSVVNASCGSDVHEYCCPH